MSSGPSSTGHALTLELPAQLQRAPELESARLPLVARAEPWGAADRFRPNLNVELLEPSPECCTIQQLSGLAIAAQLTLGTHVVACDVWRAQDRDGRRITSVYPAADSTVIQLQYAAFCGNLPLLLSLQFDASGLAWGEAVFERAVWSLSWGWEDAPALEPDAARMPVLDEHALSRGEQLERLSHIRGLQPYRASGGPAGRSRQLLPRKQRMITAVVRSDSERRPRQLKIVQTPKLAMIDGDAPPGAGREAVADVVPAGTAAIALARWLGLSPAWGFGFDGGALTESVPAALLDARVADPAAPAPAGDGALAWIWSQPWELATLQDGQQQLIVLTTPQAGAFTLVRDGDRVRLGVLPSFSYLKALLKLTGFAV